jgi:hypothetical protein
MPAIASAALTLGGRQLDLIRTKPFIRVAVVTVRPTGSTQGAYANLERDLDSANQIWQQDCGSWIYCVDRRVVRPRTGFSTRTRAR